jgi:uncharacterized membrane protein YdbT with pleckstrin-like domain
MDSINKKYEKLGYKTLGLLIWKRSLILLIILAALGLLLLGQTLIPAGYLALAQIGLTGLAAAFLVLAVIVILLGWLEYKHYKIYISDETIKVYRGLISEEEIGLPFRRVKGADIKRSLMDQILGVSDVCLTILGEDDGATASKENQLLLPMLDKKLAQEIQDIILKKAEVEEINVDQNK